MAQTPDKRIVRESTLNGLIFVWVVTGSEARPAVDALSTVIWIDSRTGTPAAPAAMGARDVRLAAS